MSYTKELRKCLPKMSQADKEGFLYELCRNLDKERNPMIRVSLKERINMLRPFITEEQWTLAKPLSGI